MTQPDDCEGAAMNWWLLGDLAMLIAFIPSELVCLLRLERTLAEVSGHIERILPDCVVIAGELDGIPNLEETQMLTGSGEPAIVRYTDALEGAR
jgi:hypothetical protein